MAFMVRMFSCFLTLLAGIITATESTICGLYRCWEICSVERRGCSSAGETKIKRSLASKLLHALLEVNCFFKITPLNRRPKMYATLLENHYLSFFWFFRVKVIYMQGFLQRWCNTLQSNLSNWILHAEKNRETRRISGLGHVTIYLRASMYQHVCTCVRKTRNVNLLGKLHLCFLRPGEKHWELEGVL